MTTSAFEIAHVVAPIVPKFIDADEEFADWCWNVIQRLQLYAAPQIQNTYSMTGMETPFETLTSASLSTLRSQATFNSVSAYTLIMLSEIGHNFTAFQEQRIGWTLLNVLLTSGQYYALLKTAFLIFKTFASYLDFSVLESSEFVNIFDSFWKHINDSNMSGVYALLSETLSCSLKTSNTNTKYFLHFWTSVVFSNKGWMYSRYAPLIFDKIAEKYIHDENFEIFLERLDIEYRRLLDSFPKFQDHNDGSIVSRLKNIYGLATSAFSNSNFPSLIFEAEFLLHVPGILIFKIRNLCGGNSLKLLFCSHSFSVRGAIRKGTKTSLRCRNVKE